MGGEVGRIWEEFGKSGKRKNALNNKRNSGLKYNEKLKLGLMLRAFIEKCRQYNCKQIN